MYDLETREVIERLKDLSDDELASTILDCLKPSIIRNAAKIKSSGISNGDFTTQFNLQISVNFNDGDYMSVKTTGFIEPNLFAPTKTGKPWSKK